MFKIMHIALVFLVAIFGITTSTSASESTFEQAIHKIGNSGEMVGLAVAVVRKGEIAFINTYGVREYGFPERINYQTTFRIASLSKAFAATVAAKLVSNAGLSLESPISKFNQDFQLRDPAQTRSATLSEVLSHRLSLPPYAYDNLLEAGVAPSQILREMKKVTPICKVGACYAYQNVGFNMVTSAIESVTHQDYATVVSNLIFKPLGMAGASFGMNGLTKNTNWARSHEREKVSSWKVRSVKQPYYDVPAAGGINASILDMAKWLNAQMGHVPKVIPLETLRALHTPVVATPAELRRNWHMERLTETHYGLGWRVYKYAGQTVINHSGSVEGYIAQIAFLPEHQVGIVTLSNSRSRQFWDILPLFLDYELGLENELLVETE